MRAFLDTEFTGLHKNTTLVSLGICYDDGSEFYAEFTDYDKSQVDNWLNTNVVSNLHLDFLGEKGCIVEDEKRMYIRGPKDYVVKELLNWNERVLKLSEKVDANKSECQFFNQLEIWSDCLAYDWVLFCDLFGGALKLPKNIYYIPFDICALFKTSGIDPDVSREDFAELSSDFKHHALFDARVIKECFTKLRSEDF